MSLPNPSYTVSSAPGSGGRPEVDSQEPSLGALVAPLLILGLRSDHEDLRVSGTHAQLWRPWHWGRGGGAGILSNQEAPRQDS